MRIENDEMYFKVQFSYREVSTGIIDHLEKTLPEFGYFCSEDKMEWHIANRHRERFTRAINNYFNRAQLSLF